MDSGAAYFAGPTLDPISGAGRRLGGAGDEGGGTSAMRVCARCERPQNDGLRFCTGCGARFPDADEPYPDTGSSYPDTGSAYPDPDTGACYPPAGSSYPPAGSSSLASRAAGTDTYVGFSPGLPPSLPPSQPPSRPPGRPPRRPVPSGLRGTPAVAVAAIAVVVLAAGAIGFWLHSGHTAQQQPGHTGRSLVGAAQTGAAGPAAAGSAAGSVAPSPTESASSPGTAGVTVAGTAAQDPAASSVATFLNAYFSAINAHDYASYFSLLSPQAQQNFTEAQFQAGYGSTSDTAETLVSVSAAPDGDTVAAVTFTSYQSATESVDQADTCTDWSISLFLAEDGGSYLIDPPPADYHASHSSCT